MKCLAFDLGGVLFGFDYNIAIDKIRGRISVSPEDIINNIFYRDFGTDFEKGIVSPRDFFDKFVKEFGANVSYNEFVKIWCEIFWPKEDMIELVKKLISNYRVYLISNINKLHFEYLKENYHDVFNLFNGLVLSFEVKAVKPQIEIYEKLKNISSCSYGDIVYIDDREDLISKAEPFGLNCIKFDNLPCLVNELEKYGVSVSPSL